MQCDGLLGLGGVSFLTLSRWLPTGSRPLLLLTRLCVTMYELLVVRFLLLHLEVLRCDSRSNEFAPYLTGVSADEMDFSRDGQWMAYVINAGSGFWKLRSDGAQPLQLTVPPFDAELPRWSPDGKWIAFMGL